MLVMVSKLIRTKDPDLADPAETQQQTQLKKVLTTLDLTSLGVGSCVGTGMYLVAGMVAHKVAGPSVVMSFIVAAVASLFSGVCYAEFGVRVPHTTGSAYMYSYVTVGEFIAFVIGWNMVLEYLIGTAAGACAISACVDAMAGGSISSAIKNGLGTFIGHTPDFLAALITFFMTLLMVAGVKKSLLFTNILNAVNLSVWVFIMAAGLFYVDTSNWSAHGGFMPFGWSGDSLFRVRHHIISKSQGYGYGRFFIFRTGLEQYASLHQCGADIHFMNGAAQGNGLAAQRMYREVLPELLADVPPAVRRRIWFQHNGATADFSRNIRNHLDSLRPALHRVGRASSLATVFS
ncbi:probable cationic amino acid transporter [Stegodyphus dumicola]|uniref:probable cationic amino acid transporter n=1 Tax=Stegodyphus dumicola TaxID=202533 RepID=UPI0015AEFD44|nr:probable cationic amino acid transporter [Stegodyphus dumicola]